MRIDLLCFATSAALFVTMNAAWAADPHSLTAKKDAAIWIYNGQSSKTDGTPIVIGDLKVGDILEVTIPPGPAHHGFITIKKGDGGSMTENPAPVLACGEAPNQKPDAALRETGCDGKPSNFGKPFTGTMKLEVLPTFKTDVDFYCFVHKTIMTGVLKLTR